MFTAIIIIIYYVVIIIALGPLYMLVTETKFMIFIANGCFSQSWSLRLLEKTFFFYITIRGVKRVLLCKSCCRHGSVSFFMQ